MSNLPVFPRGFIGNKKTLPISSDFSYRIHPVYHVKKFHNGIDIAVDVKTRITAPVRGIVRKGLQPSGAGLYIYIIYKAQDGTTYYIWFMHLHTINESVVGQEVEVGTFLGTTGGAVSDGKKAGNSKGPHLHFEIRKGSNAGTYSVDPKYYFLAQHTLFLKKTNTNVYEATDAQTFTSDALITRAMRINGATQQYVSGWDTTIENETEYEDPVEQVDYDVEGKFAPGIWQIVKLLIDSSVQDKQVADSSIAVQMGSLINFFRKVCQEPLVEFMGDTFGNNYYFIVRRPPFDKEGYIRMLESACVDISNDEIISQELCWNEQEIYSWYRYIPYGDVMGISEANYFCPALFFPDFAAIWGSRPLYIESNYFNFSQSGVYNNKEKDNSDNVNRIFRNMVKDFRYIIESNAYNAFSRRGSITLRGNRKIKRGTLITLSNGECFHVDSVSQSYSVTTNSIERTTTLQLSKGLFLPFIYGKNNFNDVFCSYFNIIDFGDYKDEDITQDNYRKIISKWHVNLNVFSFFLSRQQMIQ